MTGALKTWRARLLLFFAVVGPGFITANVDNDAGGITTYSLAGATYVTKLLWTLIPITLALVVVQEMCARIGFEGVARLDVVVPVGGYVVERFIDDAVIRRRIHVLAQVVDLPTGLETAEGVVEGQTPLILEARSQPAAGIELPEVDFRRRAGYGLLQF